MITKKLSEATNPELMAFLKRENIDVPPGYQKNSDLVTIIRTSFPGRETIEIEQAIASDVVDVTAGKVSGNLTHYSNDPKVTVNIASDPMTGGSHHFPITHNGDMILVARDMDVQIPYRHFLVLKDMKERVYWQEQNPAGGKPILREADQLALRFSVLAMPSKEEIDAWHERTDSIGRDKKKAA